MNTAGLVQEGSKPAFSRRPLRKSAFAAKHMLGPVFGVAGW